jgi:hypothetical protein
MFFGVAKITARDAGLPDRCVLRSCRAEAYDARQFLKRAIPLLQLEISLCGW